MSTDDIDVLSVTGTQAEGAVANGWWDGNFPHSPCSIKQEGG